jgi:glutathione synthase/RimK-type ligase-like ATP-grasp enzyme
MNKKKIVIITGNDNFFGQTRRPWVSINVSEMINRLNELKYKVEKYSYHELINNPDKVKESIVFYTFNQKLNRRNYISDLVHYYSTSDNLLIPSYELLKCHENKGYQELYKRKLNLKSLNAHYLSSYKEIPSYDINYPVVLKSVDGSNSKGVFLAKDEEDLVKKVKNLEKTRLIRHLDLLRRKYFRGNKKFKEYPNFSNRDDFEQYKDYIIKEENFVLQEFVPDLSFDYRVLIIYDKFFVTKRETRENDFRASGAKKFRFNFEVEDALLDYAKEIYSKFDTPYLSIDVVNSNGKFNLLEFQALHFGINVFVKSSGYFIEKESKWEFVENKNVMEHEMVYGLTKYIENNIK